MAQTLDARPLLSRLAYLGAVFLTLFIPVPEGGLDHGVLEQVYPNRGSGVWERHPFEKFRSGGRGHQGR